MPTKAQLEEQLKELKSLLDAPKVEKSKLSFKDDQFFFRGDTVVGEYAANGIIGKVELRLVSSVEEE